MTCHICHHPTQDTWVCYGCTHRLRENLDQLAIYWLLSADPTRMQPTSTAPTSGDEQNTEPPIHGARLPVRADWLDWRSGLNPRLDVAGTLHAWALDWANCYMLTTNPPRSVEALCAWLKTKLTLAISHHHPALRDFHHEISHLLRKAKYYAGETGRTDTVIRCPNKFHDDTECGYPIHISTHDTANPLQASHQCGRCGETHTTAHLLAVARHSQNPDDMVDIEVACLVGQCSESTIRRRARAGEIYTQGGRFRLVDIRPTG